MRNHFHAGCVAFLLVVLAGATGAQATYDMANYIMLSPGKWSIEESRQLGNLNGPVFKLATVVTSQGSFILQNDFDWNGTTWVPGEIRIFEVTRTHVLFRGWYHPLTLDYAVFNPPLQLPRALKLGDPVNHKGLVVTPAAVVPITANFVICDEKISKVVKAGSFTNCIRFKGSFVTKYTTETFSEILAPGHGLVASVEVEVDETEPEPKMLWAETIQRTDPKKP